MFTADQVGLQLWLLPVAEQFQVILAQNLRVWTVDSKESLGQQTIERILVHD